MEVPVIWFRRMTDLVTDAEVLAYVSAQQIQIDRDLGPAWGIQAKCVVDELHAGPGAWECWLEDHSPDPDALGFHDLTDDGNPIMHVYVGDDVRDGVRWTVTASHEVVECLGDPWIDNTVPVTGPDGVSLEYARELCDAPEDDRFAYEINGVALSAFVTPAWFDPDATAGPFTVPEMPEIAAPFQLAEGGYIGVRETHPVAGDWTQRLAAGVPGRRTVKGPWSRTMRRFRG